LTPGRLEALLSFQAVMVPVTRRAPGL